LPGSRQADGHHRVLNGEWGPRVPASEGVSSKLAGELRVVDIRRKRQFRSAFAVLLPQEPFYSAIEATNFLWHGRQTILRINATLRSRAKVGLHICTVALSRSSSTPTPRRLSKVRFEVRLGRLLLP